MCNSQFTSYPSLHLQHLGFQAHYNNPFDTVSPIKMDEQITRDEHLAQLYAVIDHQRQQNEELQYDNERLYTESSNITAFAMQLQGYNGHLENVNEQLHQQIQATNTQPQAQAQRSRQHSTQATISRNGFDPASYDPFRDFKPEAAFEFPSRSKLKLEDIIRHQIIKPDDIMQVAVTFTDAAGNQQDGQVILQVPSTLQKDVDSPAC